MGAAVEGSVVAVDGSGPVPLQLAEHQSQHANSTRFVERILPLPHFGD